MSLDREAIFRVLFDRLSTIPGLVTCSRKWEPWEQCTGKQPAIFLATGNETAQAQRDQPTIWTLRPTIYIYCRNDADPTIPGGVVMHGFLQAVEKVLERQPTEGLGSGPYGLLTFGTSLGGLVSSCSINGEIETDEGLLQNQCVAIVPLEIIATA